MRARRKNKKKKKNHTKTIRLQTSFVRLKKKIRGHGVNHNDAFSVSPMTVKIQKNLS